MKYYINNENSRHFRSEMERMKEFLCDVIALRHSITILNKDRTISPYEPSYFLYVYFLFNTIFNIDWDSSINSKAVIDAIGGEKSRINALVNFCFNDSGFAWRFKTTFNDIVCKKYPKDKILDMISKIIESDDTTVKFKTTCQNFFSENGFNERNLKAIINYIYDIRCNIVHGDKSINQLKDGAQRQRIEIYSFFLIALMMMSFSYLDYICGYEYNTEYIMDLLERYSSIGPSSPNIQKPS